MLGKKGQVVLFIIIGLVVSLIVGSVVYTVQSNRERSGDDELLIVSRAPVEARPVEDFVRSCLRESLERAVVAVSDRGGLAPSDSLAVNPFSPTESDGVPLAEGVVDGAIPYWRFLSSPNKKCPGEECVLSSKQPALLKVDGRVNSVESAIERSSKEFFDSCISDFSSLKDFGFVVTSKSVPSFSVSVVNRGVRVLLKYNIDVSKAGKSYSIDTFESEVLVPLKDFYELADVLTKEAGDTGFLEYSVLNYLSVFTGVDDLLPPVSDVDLSLSSNRWIVQDVKELVSSDIIPVAVRFLQVFPSLNYKTIESPFPMGDGREEIFHILYTRNFRTSIVNKTSKPIRASVEFEPVVDFSLSPYFDMSCDGVCSAESVNLMGFLPLGIQKYDFGYDFSYPVIVHLSDPDALGGRGFSFRFALEGNVRNNAPVMGSVSVLQSSGGDVGAGSLFSDKSQWTSGVVSIELFDPLGVGVPSASVVFECGSVATNIGVVNGSISTSLPRCLNGRLRAVKENYFSSAVIISTFTDSSQSVRIDLSPIVPVTFSVKKVPSVKNSDNVWVLRKDDADLESLSLGDKVFITMDRVGSLGDAPLTAIGKVNGGFSKGGDSIKNSSISVGKYNIGLFLMRESPIGQDVVIPPQKRCFGGGGTIGAISDAVSPLNKDDKNTINDLFNNKEECNFVPKSPIIFNQSNPLFLGQASINFTITADMISSRGVEIKLKVPYADLPSACRDGLCVVEDLSESGNSQSYVDAYPDVFLPVVVKK